MQKAIVYQFTVGDVDEPDLYAAMHLSDFEQSELGQWVMSNCVNKPMWSRDSSPWTWGYRYQVIAEFEEAEFQFWTLKWGCSIKTTL